MPPVQTTTELWETLLTWLDSQGCPDPSNYVQLVETTAGGGRGLVAKGDIPPNTTLIKIPNPALLNTKTLREFYPSHFTTTFSATQWVSLHLALQYARHDRASSPVDPAPRDKWWPFILTLPRTFPTVPLTWSIGRRTNEELLSAFGIDEDDVSLRKRQLDPRLRRWQEQLLETMPPSVRVRAEEVELRFKKDWEKVQAEWKKHCQATPEEKDSLCFDDFTLGWLNTNTRCVYFNVGTIKANNLTLAPVIDMINHADGRSTKPIQGPTHGLTFASPEARSSDPQLKDGDELAFSYGAHENPMLLTEYGFSLPANPYSHVDVTRVLEQLFEDAGEEGRLKKGVLQDSQYWGKMTLQPASASSPACADWILLLALRLLHLKLPTGRNPFDTNDVPSGSLAQALAPWYAVVAGDEEIISPLNERLVKLSIGTICDVLVLESREGVPRCEELEKKWRKEEVDDDLRASLGMLKGVWEEERVIAEAVAATCRAK